LILLVLFLASAVPLGSTCFAGDKTDQGRTEFGGDFYFVHSAYEHGSITNLTISPRFGWFVSPGLALEPRFLLVHQTVNPEVGNDFSATDFGAIFNVAYHFEGRRDSDYVPFLFGGIGFVTHSGDVGNADEVTMILPDLGAGIKFFFTDHAVFRAEFFFQHVSNAFGLEDMDADEFGIRAGVSIFIR
jgi:hypothetical protein